MCSLCVGRPVAEKATVKRRRGDWQRPLQIQYTTRRFGQSTIGLDLGQLRLNSISRKKLEVC